jgi:hypothetical protein
MSAVLVNVLLEKQLKYSFLSRTKIDLDMPLLSYRKGETANIKVIAYLNERQFLNLGNFVIDFKLFSRATETVQLELSTTTTGITVLNANRGSFQIMFDTTSVSIGDHNYHLVFTDMDSGEKVIVGGVFSVC